MIRALETCFDCTKIVLSSAGAVADLRRARPSPVLYAITRVMAGEECVAILDVADEQALVEYATLTYVGRSLKFLDVRDLIQATIALD